MEFRLCPKCNLNWIPTYKELCDVCNAPSVLPTRTKKPKCSAIKKEKSIPQSNVAFKCNYCDGGRNLQVMGFHGVCSDDVIKYNIEAAKRTWCSAPNCFCRKYLMGEISRSELDARHHEKKDVCYESSVLDLWRIGCGMVVNGKNKGKPNRLLGVRTNSLCVLTSTDPQANSHDRFIFAAFLVLRADEGSDTVAGYVEAHPNYRISFTPEEAKKLKFWNYYRNNSEKAPYQWGNNLFRYLNDEIAVKILKDIVKVKENTAEEQNAKTMLERFCQTHNLSH